VHPAVQLRDERGWAAFKRARRGAADTAWRGRTRPLTSRSRHWLFGRTLGAGTAACISTTAFRSRMGFLGRAAL